MTIDAYRLNHFPYQPLPNRDMMMNHSDTNFINIHNNYSSLLPLSDTTTASENLIPSQSPSYNPFIADFLRHKMTSTTMKPDSILAYNIINNNNNVVSVSRKRSRDSIDNYPFQSEDFSQNIYHQNTDMDNIIAQHMEKVRVELEEKRKREAVMIMEAIETRVMKKMKAKDEEIQKIERMNIFLEEKVKSLCMENQIWRELAQNNEARANALRNNLEQLLMRMKNNGTGGEDGGDVAVAAVEAAESCCSNDEYCGWRTVADFAQDNGEGTSSGRVMKMNEGCNEKKRLCRNCGDEKSWVLILPCRHLVSLCTICGAQGRTCPVCKSEKTATLNVNFS